MLADVFFYFGEKDESKITKVNVQIPIIHSFAESYNTLPVLEKVSLICAIHNCMKMLYFKFNLYYKYFLHNHFKSRQPKKKK